MISLVVTCLLSAGPSPTAPPDRLTPLLEAKDPAGQPRLNDSERAYFAGLAEPLKQLLIDATASKTISSVEQLKDLLSLNLSPEKFSLLMKDNCVLCHSDPQSQSNDTLFTADPKARGSAPHLNLAHLVSDVHFRRGLSCAGCHGGDPASDMPEHEFVAEWQKGPARKRDRSWIPAFCSRCHSDPSFMRSYNPGLPTDQLAKYKTSQHGKLLLEKKDSRAAQCVSCHGVHGILSAKSPGSRVYPKNVPETCGACHASREIMAGLTLADGSPIPTDQLAEYKTSVHGKALLERGDLGAPACNDCHGNHSAMPPEVSRVAQVCRSCHARNGELFEGSKHKQAFEKHGWPECEKCHGNHAVMKTSDDLVGTGPLALCGTCHNEHAKDNKECNSTADYFFATLTRLDTELAYSSAKIERLAARGLDVEPLEAEASKLSDSLRQSRSTIHAFSRTPFAQIAAPGEQAILASAELADAAMREFRFRRNGMVIAIGFTGLLILGLWLRVRRMER